MIILYSTGCSRCKVLEARMKAKNIKYNLVEDIDVMLAKGIQQVPVLQVDGKMMDFVEAVKWTNQV